MSRIISLAIGQSDGIARRDQVLPITRLVGGVIAPILLGAFVILYGFPGRTTQLFAWTIRPDMTPLVMGAGYGTGVYFFYRVVTIDEWHRVDAVFPGIAVFTWFMALATVLHWENFNHAHVTFYLWTLLYVASPFVVPGLWLLNRRAAPIPPTDTGRVVPEAIRWPVGLSGLAITLTAVGFFVAPDSMIANWPWDISPLTARILLGWFVILGVVNIVLFFDARWSAWRIPAHSMLIGLSLVLLAALRASGDFEASDPIAWGVFGGLAAYLVAVALVYGFMEYRN